MRLRLRAGAAAWRLAQTFWVGGLWLLHFVVVPALQRIGLAPLLVEEVGAGLRALLVAFAAFCVVLQGLILAQAEGFPSLWQQARGRLLLGILLISATYPLLRAGLPGAEFAPRFVYLLLGFCGALLVLQPVPGQSRS
nr:DUF4149 domain-containing protein [Pseudomonas kuykendallii]